MNGVIIATPTKKENRKLPFDPLSVDNTQVNVKLGACWSSTWSTSSCKKIEIKAIIWYDCQSRRPKCSGRYQKKMSLLPWTTGDKIWLRAYMWFPESIRDTVRTRPFAYEFIVKWAVKNFFYVGAHQFQTYKRQKFGSNKFQLHQVNTQS